MEIDRTGKSFWREVAKKIKGREGIDENIEESVWIEHLRKHLGDEEIEKREVRERLKYEERQDDISEEEVRRVIRRKKKKENAWRRRNYE